MLDTQQIRITGLMFYYYFICKRKLWYFYNEISMEQNHENVQLGKLLDETAYCREKKHINIDDVINIDYISEGKELHEIKKSKSLDEASEWQVKYYLYYLKKRGVNGVVGRIDYPLIKKTTKVILKPEDNEEIEQILEEINNIVKEAKPQQFREKKICKSCAYCDLCMI